MHFAQLTTSLLTLAIAGCAAMSSDTVVANVEEVTQLSADTNTIAVKINLLNFARYAPQVGSNLAQIVATVTKYIADMSRNDKRDLVEDIDELTEGTVKAIWPKKRQAAPPFTEANQQAICDAFRGFVRVHEALLATVIGKHGLLSLMGFAGPIATTLRELEGVVDVLAFGIIDLVPICAQSATQDKNALDRSLRDAVDTYN
ncbi:hypothetical protein LMH87_000363 [Akanthomyces muscarius]|uniref:Cell wall galactomannoprotein n=1 Tax=Akanthomyces muscarius TaxID=2231603 RepID=A0A9W8QHS3_AKAMU|nr:hypothetical protein LMH87_000363 [Akanthomyces muscarius]KAJ4155098.1 hypothetical protein LMH87_000363 [Akanthomyces muscarius]